MHQPLITNHGAEGDTFNQVYPELTHKLFLDGVRQDSRVGSTIELTDYQTIINNPNQRCFGGYNRNPNIFFLIAESLWIFAGRCDVKFLTLFNEQMAEYSDNGVTFHAPYGWRLRNAGVYSSSRPTVGGVDQVKKALCLLSENPSDRRVVLSIWDRQQDFAHVGKDIPCNDLIFLKIRNGKLIQTISNRSNDLHWGLSTNTFQFSMLGELFALILGIPYGQQIHNSSSLHYYENNDITSKMLKIKLDSELSASHEIDLNCRKIDFNFDKNHSVDERCDDITSWIMRILEAVENISLNKTEDIKMFLDTERLPSKALRHFLFLMVLYKERKVHKITNKEFVMKICKHLNYYGNGLSALDGYFLLALNFVMARCKNEKELQELRSYITHQFGIVIENENHFLSVQLLGTF